MSHCRLCTTADKQPEKKEEEEDLLKDFKHSSQADVVFGCYFGEGKNKTKPLSVAVSSSLPKPARFASEHCATLGGEGLELLTLSIKRKADRRKHNAKHTLVEGFLQKINYL